MISGPDNKKIFHEKGVVFISDIISKKKAEELRDEIIGVLNGCYSTGISPDKVKWRPGSDEQKVISVCNAWKSSLLLTRFIEGFSSLYSTVQEITGWTSIKLNQDSVIAVPSGAKGVTFHQDNSYQKWHIPGEIVTCWISLSDLVEGTSAVEFIGGSHLWELGSRVETFTDLDDPEYFLKQSKRYQVKNLERIRFKYRPGDCSLHHGQIWHGSKQNLSKNTRYAYALHLMPGWSKFGGEVSPYFSRFKLLGSDEMNDTFFPLVYSDER